MKTLNKIYYALVYILIGVIIWLKLASQDHSGFECFCGASMGPYVLIEIPRIFFGK